MKQTLTWATVRENALKAHKEDRLQAQIAPSGTCVYRLPDKPDCGCAIGVSLTDESIQKVNITMTVFGLISEGIIHVPTKRDQNLMMDLQGLHDQWCSIAEQHRHTAEKHFLQFLTDNE